MTAENSRGRDAIIGRFNINTKLILITSTLVIATMTAMIFIASYFFREDTEVRVRENNHRTAHVIASQTEAFLTVYISRIQGIIKQARSTSPATVKKAAFEHEKNLLYAGTFKVTKKKLVSGIELENSKLLRKLGYRKKAIERALDDFHTTLKQASSGGIIVAPMINQGGSGFLAIGLPQKKNNEKTIVSFLAMNNFLDPYQQAGITETFLVDAQGYLVAHGNKALLKAGANLSELPIVQRMLRSKIDNEQIEYNDQDNLKYLGSFKKLNIAGLAVIATASQQRAFEAVYAIQRRNLIILAITLSLTILVLYFFAKTLSGPIISLVDATYQFQEGDFNLKDLEGRDEIGFLTNSFNRMVESIKESQQKLRDYADNLEEKVEQRTLELSEANGKLRAAKNETDSIMASLTEGLFLIDKDFVFGNEYSAALPRIYEKDSLAQLNFLDIHGQWLNEEDLNGLKGYLELMFSNDMPEDMLAELNPIDEVKVIVNNNTKYLRTNFNRIKNDDGEIIYLMGTVEDATNEITLARELEQAQKKNQAQVERLMTILHVDPQLLNNFLVGAQIDLNMVNEGLKSDPQKEDFAPVLNNIYRSIHSIKGNAALLNVDYYAEAAHLFEENIGALQEKDDLKAEDFISLTQQLAEIQDIHESTNELVEKLLGFQEQFGQKTADVSMLILKTIEKTVASTSLELGKKVKFVYNNFNHKQMPSYSRSMIKDVLVQLVRNSISHGIEMPEERSASNKPETGTILLKSQLHDDYFIFTLEDDGRGLQVEKLREKAAQLKQFKGEDIESWGPDQLAQVIFIPGLSTAEKTTMVAGRGIGMDIIKDRIESQGGQVGLEFETGKFCRFELKVPLIPRKSRKLAAKNETDTA